MEMNNVLDVLATNSRCVECVGPNFPRFQDQLKARKLAELSQVEEKQSKATVAESFARCMLRPLMLTAVRRRQRFAK